MRLPRRTSSTSATERSWPTASGDQRVGQRDRLAQRQDGQRPRHGRADAPSSTALLLARVGDLDRSGHQPSRTSWSRSTSIGTECVPALGPDERQLDAQHPVAVGGARRVGDDVGAERDHAPEGPEVDLELLVDAALGVGRPAVAGEDELAAVDLQRELVGVDAGQLGLDDGARRIALVEDVDRRARSRRVCAEPGRCGRRRLRRARPSRGACARSWRTGRAREAWSESTP